MDSRAAPRRTCPHAGASEYVVFRSYEEAVKERDAMAVVRQDLLVSEVYRHPAGWGWTACLECLEEEGGTASGL